MDASAVVVLDIYTSARETERRIESRFSLAWTACRVLEDRGIKYSVFTDAAAEGSLESVRYVPSAAICRRRGQPHRWRSEHLAENLRTLLRS